MNKFKDSIIDDKKRRWNAIRILEGAVECQVSVDGLVVASEAIDKLKTCENRGQ